MYPGVKITKQNAAIEYMQKVTVAELKAMQLSGLPLDNGSVLHALWWRQTVVSDRHWTMLDEV